MMTALEGGELDAREGGGGGVGGAKRLGEGRGGEVNIKPTICYIHGDGVGGRGV